MPSVEAPGRPPLRTWVALLGLVIAAAIFTSTLETRRSGRVNVALVPRGRIPVAVLGDSDSHSYRDSLNGVVRGGTFHDVTFQWTEVLQRLRVEDFDLGTFERWGQRGSIARLRTLVGLPARTPAKDDFRYNFAYSGAGCASLRNQWPWQSRWVVSLLDSNPERWAEGLVLLKVGVNDLGQVEHLKEYAASGLTPGVQERIGACVTEITATVLAIRAVSPVAIVVVGIADDSSRPAPGVPNWSPAEVMRIRDVLDRFDSEISRSVATVDRVAFMSDRDWYYDSWPDRRADGSVQTGGVSLGGKLLVTNTRGDHPAHLMLADGHAGTVANGIWARYLIRLVNETFGFGIRPIRDWEIASLVDPAGELGLAPPAEPVPGF